MSTPMGLLHYYASMWFLSLPPQRTFMYALNVQSNQPKQLLNERATRMWNGFNLIALGFKLLEDRLTFGEVQTTSLLGKCKQIPTMVVPLVRMTVDSGKIRFQLATAITPAFLVTRLHLEGLHPWNFPKVLCHMSQTTVGGVGAKDLCLCAFTGSTERAKTLA